MHQQEHRRLDESRGAERPGVDGLDVECLEEREDLLLRRLMVSTVEERRAVDPEARRGRIENVGEWRPPATSCAPFARLEISSLPDVVVPTARPERSGLSAFTMLHSVLPCSEPAASRAP